MSFAMSIPPLEYAENEEREVPSPSRDNIRVFRTHRERPKHDSVLAGQLKEVSLFSILQALAGNGATGNLIIRGGVHSGSLYVDSGQLVFASQGRHRGAKALYRLVEITEGRFEFFSPGREPAERNLAGGLEMHLIEAARHQDEIAVLRDSLPSGAANLIFNKNMVAPVAKIPSPVLEVMAAIHRHESVGGVLDGCALPDLDIVKILLNLIKNNVVLVGSD